MKFDIVTIFPRALESYLKTSILDKAQKKGLVKVRTVDLRDFAKDRHATTDDKPYGGGPGMVIKVGPVYRAVQFLKSKIRKKKVRVVLFSTRGKQLDQKMARRLAGYDHLIMISGRYEGVDERVAKKVADEEVSIGDYVLSGGELPALVLLEAVSRHIPGVLGKEESLEEIKGSYPVYTRPEVFETKEGKMWRVPKVLTSGDHKKIEEWRREK